jgi:hypothetical protein
MDDSARLLAEAARCRRLAAAINDKDTIAKLLKLAAECEAKVRADNSNDPNTQ